MRRGRGWMVEGPLAGSPAEEAGILGGETLLEIGVAALSAVLPCTHIHPESMLIN